MAALAAAALADAGGGAALWLWLAPPAGLPLGHRAGWALGQLRSLLRPPVGAAGALLAAEAALLTAGVLRGILCAVYAR